MKQTFSLLALLLLTAVQAVAQKTVYIPNEWKTGRTDTLLYKESDPNNEYTWSKSRSVEGPNVILFWDKYYTKNPKDLAKSDFYYVDMDDLLAKCEAFYDLEINQLGFVNPEHSNLSKYKVMVLMNHTTEWTCYGGGYDYQVSALWLNPSTCKPVGHAVAHEVGHSFHYMCYAEHAGHQESSTDGTGFHLPLGNGQTIWEQTAQWQACQSFPGEMYNESIGIFRNTHNYAYSHEWHRYQSYWFHYFINQYYNNIQTVAQVWNQPMTGAVDFNQSLMALKNLSARELYHLYFDYACRLVTWDLTACEPYRDHYIGDFNYRCVLASDTTATYQVALSSCPQGTGFNVIPLQLPAAGTTITTRLAGVPVGQALLEADPGEYMDGDSRFVKYNDRHYVNGGARTYRGFRMGYVALMNDGSRQYFSEDSIYCQGTSTAEASYQMTVPEGVSRLWLVVSPALKSYIAHKWDESIAKDDMWPYRFTLEGTDIGAKATVYANGTIDERDPADATFTYDVTFPLSSDAYTGTTVNVNGRAAAALATAMQLQTSGISAKMQDWNANGPTAGKIMFYAVAPDGTLSQSGSTANGFGHWFDATGTVSAYANGTLFSEFSANQVSFSLGQYPGRMVEGKTYTLRQALRYRYARTKECKINFVFNITAGATAQATLRNIDYTDPRTLGIDETTTTVKPADNAIYDLQGRRLTAPKKGINIIGGRKVIF